MHNTWIMLANETKAYIYSVNKDNIELLDTLKHAESRMQDHEMVSDRSGSYHTPTVGGTGHFQPETEQHIIEQQIFARELGAFLANACNMHHYKELVICAEPHFYGMIKKELTSHVWNSVTHHILRDYIPLSENKIQEIIKHLVQTRFKDAA